MIKDTPSSPSTNTGSQVQSMNDCVDTRQTKSNSQQIKKRDSYDYSGSQMHCQLQQKGLVSKKKINLYIQNNKVILSNEAYAKKPKKIIELGFHDMVKWQVQKSDTQVIYTGMTLVLRREKDDKTIEKVDELEFFGDSVILEQLKHYLSKYIFQNRIQDEYIIQAQIGKGNYARVFSARHRGTNVKIALKCFEKEKLKTSPNGYVRYQSL